MAKHAYFEELCALAPLGELSPHQLRELDEHVANCDECRQATIDYQRFFQQVVPAVTRSDEEYIESRKNDIRASVLRSVATIDLEREKQPVHAGQSGFSLDRILAVFQRRLAFSVLSGIGVLGIAAGSFWLGTRFQHHIPEAMSQAAAPATALVPTITKAPKPQPPVIAPTVSAEPDKALLSALDGERQRNAELAQKLSVDGNKLAEAVAAQDVLRSQIAQQTALLAATKSDLDNKAAALAQARNTGSSDAATIASLEIQVHDLTEKANTQNASLDRERDLLSHGREIRDIIGARNLHIIDVYDTSTGGATRRPFARAFYTEGKSLVYYAYDLPERRVDQGKFSYVAWGQSNGNKASIRKIGILFHDDQTQTRWSLDFSNPQVLKEIDSVFITMERSDEDLAQPKGKRMLTAYLGTAPNHP